MAGYPTRRFIVKWLGSLSAAGLTKSDLSGGCAGSEWLAQSSVAQGDEGEEYSQTAPSIGLFTQATGTPIPRGVNAVHTSGFDHLRQGAGLYLSDPKTTMPLAKAHHRAAFRAADGRIFRLAESVLRPEMFGAQADGISNDQPAFQAMFDYAHLFGITRVRLRPVTYSIWCPARTNRAVDLSPDGVPLVVRSSMIITGQSRATCLAFRSPTGGDRTHQFQLVGGKVWRGGGLYLIGNRDERPILNIAYFKMHGVKLDGGITPSYNHGECTVSNGGDGWDETDKGFRIQDSRVGHVLLDEVEITGFRGELAYGGGTGSILSMTTWRCWFHGTNADAYNFDCGQPIIDVESRWGNAFQPIEAHGGPGSRFERTIWYDCKSGGTLWGGRIGAVDADGALLPGTTYSESAPDRPGHIPWIVLKDVKAVRCGNDSTPLLLANWIKGTIQTIDTNVYLNPTQTGQLTTIELVISAVADTRPVDSAVGLSGAVSMHQTGYGGRIVHPPNNIKIEVSMEQTSNAISHSFGFRLPVQFDGYFGDKVSVTVLRGKSAIYPRKNGLAPSMPLIEDKNLEVSDSNNAFLVEFIDNNRDLEQLQLLSTHIRYVGSNSDKKEIYTISPSTQGYADGQIVTLQSGMGNNKQLVLIKTKRLIIKSDILALQSGQEIVLRFSRRLSAWVQMGLG